MIPIILGVLLFFVFTPPAWADSNVVLNELLPHPSSGDDWVELYNPTEGEVNLNGWKLKDMAASPIHTFNAADVVPAKGYLVYNDNANRLNNSEDTIYLVDNNSVTVDTYNYASSSLETSFGRVPDGGNTWKSFPAPTKGTSNGDASPTSSPSPTTISSAGLSLSEFYPYPPSVEQEWAEIYNDNPTIVSLSGFKIDDIEGGSSPSPIPTDTTIPAKGYLYLKFDKKLNNSGDTIRFLAPDGAVIESFTYKEITQGSSWAKNSAGQWEQTSIPTMGKVNQFSNPTTSSSPTPTKNGATVTPKPTLTTSPSLAKSNQGEVLGEKVASNSSNEATSETTTIKLFDDQNQNQDQPKVLGDSTSKYLSWGMIALGIGIILIPAIIIFRRRHAAKN